MAQPRFCPNGRLWALIAVGLFVALGFVDPLAGAAKGDNSLWAYVGLLVRGEYYCDTGEIVGAIGFRTALLAVYAALIGWVAQALLMVAWSSIRCNRPDSVEIPPENGSAV